jgi:hypothetical protein
MMFVQWKIVGKERVRLLMLQCLVLTASVILVGRRYRLVLWPSPIVVFPTVSASLPVSLRACMCWLECEVLMIFFVSVLKLITIMSMPASRIYVFCTQQNRYIYIYIYIYIYLFHWISSACPWFWKWHTTIWQTSFLMHYCFFYLVSYAWYFFFPLGCLLNFRQALKYSYNLYNTFLLCCDTDPISDVLICSEVR